MHACNFHNSGSEHHLETGQGPKEPHQGVLLESRMMKESQLYIIHSQLLTNSCGHSQLGQTQSQMTHMGLHNLHKEF